MCLQSPKEKRNSSPSGFILSLSGHSFTYSLKLPGSLGSPIFGSFGSQISGSFRSWISGSFGSPIFAFFRNLEAPCHCNSVTYIYVHFPHSCWSKWIISFKGRSSESFHCNISAIIGFAPLNFLPVPLTSIIPAIRQFVSTPIPSSFEFHTNKDIFYIFHVWSCRHGK